jgi:large subunit ribosomal protein L24
MIKKGDTVLVISGKNKGKKGKVLSVLPADNKLVVERVNIAKRHQRPTRNFQGGIIEKPLPLNASKVMLLCPRCSEPTRVGRKMIEEKWIRVCRKCEEIIDKV